MKIIITSPVQHDGKPLEIGDQVDVSKKDAQALIESGSAELAGGKAKAPAAAPAVPVVPAAPAGTDGADGDSSLLPGDDGADGAGNPPADA